jgi:chromosome segregation ATPase
MMHNMATEIASLRQALLGKQLSSKKETESLRAEIDEVRRECNRLQAYNRIHKSDRDIRLSEMTGTIRVLSARSDIHSQLVAARQEVESEKLSCSHLRLDLDAYRGMLESEQRTNSGLKRQIDVLQAQLDSVGALKTIIDVPGVQPAALIELFSVKLTTAQNDVMKAKAEAAQLSASLKAAGATKVMASSRTQPLKSSGLRKEDLFSEKSSSLMVLTVYYTDLN